MASVNVPRPHHRVIYQKWLHKLVCWSYRTQLFQLIRNATDRPYVPAFGAKRHWAVKTKQRPVNWDGIKAILAKSTLGIGLFNYILT